MSLTPTFGKPYAEGVYMRKRGRAPICMWRKGQRVRWYTAKGVQVGPEQSNVAPALAWALWKGYRHPGMGAPETSDCPSPLPHSSEGHLSSACTSCPKDVNGRPLCDDLPY